MKSHKPNIFEIGITFYRVIVCLIIVKNIAYYLPMADDLFGKSSIYPFESYVQLMSYYKLNFLIYPFHIDYAPHLFLMVMAASTIFYMLAIGGRFNGFFLYILIIILKIRNGFILDGSDNVIQVTFPFLILADNLNYFRLFERKKHTNYLLQNVISNYATIALKVQVCFVYFFTSIEKMQGDLWLNGTAIYYTMRVRDFMATSLNIPLTENHYFVVISTYGTVLWELCFPFLVWFKSTRTYIVLGGVMLHVGIWLFMRIDNFSWVMISTYFIFFTNSQYQNLLNSRYFKKWNTSRV